MKNGILNPSRIVEDELVKYTVSLPILPSMFDNNFFPLLNDCDWLIKICQHATNDCDWWIQTICFLRLELTVNSHKIVLQVVDMRWGVPEHASDNHSTTDLCINEILKCQELSAGPNFVVRDLSAYCLCVQLRYQSQVRVNV